MSTETPQPVRPEVSKGERGLRKLLALAATLLLAACAQQPAPVVYHASGNPPTLSAWNVVFVQGGRLHLNAGVIPYDLNTPLFSDYAHKLRTLSLPPGSAAKYDADASFDFPVGTVISKTFYYPRAANANGDLKAVARTYDTSREFAGNDLDMRQVRLIETRILVRRAEGWAAIPYVWNAEQTEAVLARTGDTLPLELVADDGAREAFTYVVPNENQCAGCHVLDLKSRQLAPIGPKARHLNRDFAYVEGSENQLAHLTRLGLLTGAPPSDRAPRNANWRDPKQNLDARDRAYLDVNCGHCHSATGPANTTALSLDIGQKPDLHLGLCKPPVAAGRGTGDHRHDIVPGHPEESILPYRLESAEPGVMMPEQGRSVVHREGVALIREWIGAWPGSCDDV